MEPLLRDSGAVGWCPGQAVVVAFSLRTGPGSGVTTVLLRPSSLGGTHQWLHMAGHDDRLLFPQYNRRWSVMSMPGCRLIDFLGSRLDVSVGAGPAVFVAVVVRSEGTVRAAAMLASSMIGGTAISIQLPCGHGWCGPDCLGVIPGDAGPR